MSKPIVLDDFSINKIDIKLLSNITSIIIKLKDINHDSDSNKIVLCITKSSDNKKYIIETFDYIGSFLYKGVEFKIKYSNHLKLKDYSYRHIICTDKYKKLYQKVSEGGFVSLSTSVCEVVGSKKDDEPILEIKKGLENNEIIITTFGYVGRFNYLGVDFNIGYRFGDTVLNRMISKVNDFEVKSLSLEAENVKKQTTHDSLALKILYMNFILKLEKLSVIGLPKSYTRVEHHDNKLKGQLDINRFIKKDIPFQGKVSSTSYKQLYVQEIVDVLYGALSIVEISMSGLINDRVFQVRNLLNHYANRVFVDERTIENAIHHKSIQNSLYSDFKNILEIASYIINHNPSLTYKKDSFLNGLIFDVSLLWESYLYKLLKDNFEDDNWEVIHEDSLLVYESMFYSRYMKPDIVIKNETKKQVIVFDAKSKSMNFQKGIGDGKYGDLDRSDFFQINTYMSYYSNKGYDVIAGGLFYPITSEFDCRFDDNQNCNNDYSKRKAHSDKWFGNDKTQFIVDGIDLSKDNLSMDDISESENAFIERIQKISENAK